MHELSIRLPEPWNNMPVSYIPGISGKVESVNIGDMNQNQILRAVAQKRIEQYTSLREAAESLNIDIRTLQRYAHWEEPDK